MRTEKKIFSTALALWGEQLQLDMLVEECAELIQAVTKLHRSKGSYIHLWEEIADVEIMIDQMRLHFSDQMIDHERKKKLERLEERITEKLKGQEDSWPLAKLWMESESDAH